jgi:RNA polymerase sigma-70 factor (ECF subfamily)
MQKGPYPSSILVVDKTMAQLTKITTRTSPLPATYAGRRAPDAGDLMAVVAAYQGSLLRYVGHMLGRIDDEAEDVVQEVFVRLHGQVAGHGPNSVRHLTTWLFRVAHNLTLDVIRKRTRLQRIAGDGTDPAALTEEQAADELDALGEVLRREARDVALRELAQLDEDLRQVVLLKIIQGMTLRQVSEVVGVSLSAVNYRLNQGLTELAKRLRRAGVV